METEIPFFSEAAIVGHITCLRALLSPLTIIKILQKTFWIWYNYFDAAGFKDRSVNRLEELEGDINNKLEKSTFNLFHITTQPSHWRSGNRSKALNGISVFCNHFRVVMNPGGGHVWPIDGTRSAAGLSNSSQKEAETPSCLLCAHSELITSYRDLIRAGITVGEWEPAISLYYTNVYPQIFPLFCIHYIYIPCQ